MNPDNNCYLHLYLSLTKSSTVLLGFAKFFPIEQAPRFNSANTQIIGSNVTLYRKTASIVMPNKIQLLFSEGFVTLLLQFYIISPKSLTLLNVVVVLFHFAIYMIISKQN